ncbi:MAG: helix-turn-helix domain-containing protein [Nanoarchaeota archaeon]
MDVNLIELNNEDIINLAKKLKLKAVISLKDNLKHYGKDYYIAYSNWLRIFFHNKQHTLNNKAKELQEINKQLFEQVNILQHKLNDNREYELALKLLGTKFTKYFIETHNLSECNASELLTIYNLPKNYIRIYLIYKQHNQGVSQHWISKYTGLSTSFVNKICKRLKEEKLLVPKYEGKKVRFFTTFTNNSSLSKE